MFSDPALYCVTLYLSRNAGLTWLDGRLRSRGPEEIEVPNRMLLGLRLEHKLASVWVDFRWINVINLNVTVLTAHCDDWARIRDCAFDRTAGSDVWWPEFEEFEELDLRPVRFDLVHNDLAVDKADCEVAEFFVIVGTERVAFLVG